MLGWSLPRLTKTWLTPYSHKASKKAKDAVYLHFQSVFRILLYNNLHVHHGDLSMKETPLNYVYLQRLLP